jgi:cell division protein FtsL
MTEKVKRPRRKLLPGLVGTVLLLAVIISFCVRQAEVMAARRRLAEIEREIEYYRAMNEALMEQVETLKSPEHIEKVAREKLGLVMPGEVQYMLVTKAE